MHNILQLLKNWTLPIAMLAGTGVYLLFAHLPFLFPLKPWIHAATNILTPTLIFVMLFVTFCKVPLRQLKPSLWHLWLALFQVVSCIIVAVAILCSSHSYKFSIAAESFMVCIICPTATAAAVITEKLGGNPSSLTTYTILSNIVAAITIPFVFPLVEPHEGASFNMAFATIMQKVFPLLICPLITALLLRRYASRLIEKITSIRDLAFYLWSVALAIVVAQTLRSIVHSQASLSTLLLLGASGFAACAIQFFLGKRIGGYYNDRISGGQALGQKNTVFAIWLSYTYLSPISSLGPGTYVLWQNLFNSWQLWRKRRAALRSRTAPFLLIPLLSFSILSCERIEIPETPTAQEDSKQEEPSAPLPEIEDEQGVRNGTQENPYKVSDIQRLYSPDSIIKNVWVQGYIVGYLASTSYKSARFSALEASETNLLLADNYDVQDMARCLPVALPAKGNVRQELNLKDHPANHKRIVKLKGDIETYYTVAGMKGTSAYVFNQGSAAEDMEYAQAVSSFYHDFTENQPGDSLSLEGWTTLGPSSGYWHIGHTRTNKFATITHTDSIPGHPFEYWLISPPVKVGQMKNAVLTFQTAYNRWDGKTQFDVFVLGKRVPEESSSIARIKAYIACPEATPELSWISSGEITFNSYSGLIYIGFRYKGESLATGNTIFRLDEILLREK